MCVAAMYEIKCDISWYKYIFQKYVAT